MPAGRDRGSAFLPAGWHTGSVTGERPPQGWNSWDVTDSDESSVKHYGLVESCGHVLSVP